MKLTPEQRTAVERAKVAGEPRVFVDLTPEQRAEAERTVAAAEAGIPENIKYLRKLRDAEREPGFSGDLRRAIAATRKSPEEVAAEAGLDEQLIDRFCCGEAILPSDVIDKLVEHLGLQLTQPIR
jgi:hypothetical protein